MIEPISDLKNTDFPAPFGPMITVIDGTGICSVTSSSARLPSKVTVSPLVIMESVTSLQPKQ